MQKMPTSTSCSLTTVTLSTLNDDILVSIGRNLPPDKLLRRFCLVSTCFYKAGMKALTTIDIMDIVVQELEGKIFSHLKGTLYLALQVCYVDIKSEKFIEHGQLPGLRSLSFCMVKVDDTWLSNLKNLTHLASLNLAWTKVGDAGLPALEGLTNLDSLNLCGTKVTDAGLPCLATLSNLTKLDLSFSKITDFGLPTLATLTKLKSLSVRDTALTDDGLYGLKAVRPDLTVIFWGM